MSITCHIRKVPGLQKGCINIEGEGEDVGGSEDSDEGECLSVWIARWFIL